MAIAMENPHLVDDLHIKNTIYKGFAIAMFECQRVYHVCIYIYRQIHMIIIINYNIIYIYIIPIIQFATPNMNNSTLQPCVKYRLKQLGVLMNGAVT